MTPVSASAVAPGREVALLGASFDTGNLGVSALASGAIAAVRQGWPKARVILLDYARLPSPESDRIDGQPVAIEKINLRFSKQPWLPNHIARLLFVAGLIRLVPVRSWRRRLVRRHPWLRRIAEPACHLSLAGGDSFSDIYGARRLAYVALPQLLVLLLEKPLVLLPQTYGPFRGRLARWFARPILRRARGIYSRDQEGLAVVTQLQGGRGPRPEYAADLGFALDPLPPPPAALAQLQRLRQSGPLVGFNLSGLLAIGGYGGGNRFGLKSDYLGLVRELLDHFTVRRGVQVLLIPHVYGEGEASECDWAASQAFVRAHGPRYGGRLHLLEGRFDHHETKHIIGACDFLQASRMHACIAALSQSVPAVGLAYSRKFAGVMESVGAGPLVVDLRTLEPAAVIAAVDRAWQDRALTRQRLLASMPAVRLSVLGWFGQPELQALLREQE